MINSVEKKKEKEKITLQKDIVQEKIASLKGSQNASELQKLKKLEKELITSEKKLQVKIQILFGPKHP